MAKETTVTSAGKIRLAAPSTDYIGGGLHEPSAVF